MRTNWCSAASIALALVSQVSCAPATSTEPGHGILVIAIDALRYDHLGIGGYDRKTSPALDTLANEGVFFRAAYAAAPWQVPAHMALLSAADPRIARRFFAPGVSVNQATLWHLPDEAAHPAAEFLANDFRTALFYDHPNLAAVYGYQRGFELYQGPYQDDDPSSPDFGSEAVFRRFEQWLARSPQDKNWFAYLEMADLERVWTEVDPSWDTFFPPRPELSRVPPVGDAQHLFFSLPRSRWSGGMTTLGEYEARYDGAIAQLDAAFRVLRTQMERVGRWKNTTVVVVGAYGMSFGESGLLLDSGTFSDVDLHVPLIVRPASGIEMKAGLKSDSLVSTIDLMPTLLEISGVTSGVEFTGRSFKLALKDDHTKDRSEAQASCAFQEGFATLNKQYCFERTWPGRVQDPHLSASWFGDSERRPGVVREVLHNRQENPILGDGLTPTKDSAAATALVQLRESGEKWATKIEAQRAMLQGEHAPAAGAATKKSDGQ